MNDNEPTEAQLARIYALLEHPSVNGEYLDSIGLKLDSFLVSKRRAGVLIGILKKKTGWDGKTPLD